MDNNLINFFMQHVGEYNPTTYQAINKIVTTTDGAVETWEYEVIPDGVAGLDIPYISRVVMLIMVLFFLYSTIKWSLQLFANISNPSRRKINMK